MALQRKLHLDKDEDCTPFCRSLTGLQQALDASQQQQAEALAKVVALEGQMQELQAAQAEAGNMRSQVCLCPCVHVFQCFVCFYVW